MNSMICPYCGKLIAYNSYFDVFYCSKCGGFFKQATVMECNDLNEPLTLDEIRQKAKQSNLYIFTYLALILIVDGKSLSKSLTQKLYSVGERIFMFPLKNLALATIFTARSRRRYKNERIYYD